MFLKILDGIIIVLALVGLGFNIWGDFELDLDRLTFFMCLLVAVVCGHINFTKHPRDE